MTVQVGGDARSVGRQGHTVGVHPVGPDVLSGEDRGPSRHADHVLVHCPPVVDAVPRQAVQHRRAGHRPAVAAQAVVALLVGRHEQDLAAHGGQLPGLAWMKSMTTAASSGPRSSWRKWPPPLIVWWLWPLVPGTRSRNSGSAPRVIGSASL